MSNLDVDSFNSVIEHTVKTDSLWTMPAKFMPMGKAAQMEVTPGMNMTSVAMNWMNGVKAEYERQAEQKITPSKQVPIDSPPAGDGAPAVSEAEEELSAGFAGVLERRLAQARSKLERLDHEKMVIEVDLAACEAEVAALERARGAYTGDEA